jgi:hypothetical protein
MNNSNRLDCISCKKSYKISALSDSEFCEDCINDIMDSPYDKEYEADVIVLCNPAGKTQPVYIE